MENYIIITGHGKFSTGLKSSIELVIGETHNIFFVDFLKEDSSEILKEKYMKVIKENNIENLVFVCDLLGGTPFNTAVQISAEYEHFKVVTGCNLNAILESIILKDNCSVEEVSTLLVEKTKSTVLEFLEDSSLENEESQCGI